MIGFNTKLFLWELVNWVSWIVDKLFSSCYLSSLVITYMNKTFPMFSIWYEYDLVDMNLVVSRYTLCMVVKSIS